MILKTIKLISYLMLVIFNLMPVAEGQSIINPDSTIQAILDELEGMKLTLSQAQQYALNNSTAVRRAEAIYMAASGSLRRERGLYDPEFFFNINYQDLEEPTASFFAGAPVLMAKRTTTQTGLRLNLPIGTELEFSLNTMRLKTNSEFAFLNPEYNTFGSLSLRQPLLRGFTVSARKELTQTELLFDAAKARYDQEVLIVNSNAELLYWTLYTSERDYAVQKLALARAEAFLTETEFRAVAGLVGPNQVANAKTFLAEQKLLLIDIEEQLDTQSDMLASLIGIRPEGHLRFKVVDIPPADFIVEPVDELVELTLENNLHLKAARKNMEVSDLMVRAAEWELLPRVDLIGSLSGTGLGGESQDVIFGSDTLRGGRSGSFGDALGQVFNRDSPGWSVGVEVSLPIGFRSGLGERDRLEAEADYVEQSYIELSRSLEEQVRTFHRELSNGNNRLKAAMEGVEAAQEQIRIGMIEFQNGRLTAFELVRLNQDFASAQRRYSEALVRTVKAAAILKQLTSGRF